MITMNKRLLLSLLWVVSSLSLFASPCYVYNQTCEQAENPLGVETQTPHFSWKLKSSERNVSQTAYQIIVSDAKNAIEHCIGNIWDSGKQTSSQSILVPYTGKKLQSFGTYYWKVRSWNQKGEVSEWSGEAQFTMGVLSVADWNGAKWVALEKDNPVNRYVRGAESTKRIPDYDKKTPYPMPQFRKEFGANKPVRKALAYISGLGQFEMFLNGKKVGNHVFDPGWTDYDSLALYVSFDVTKMLNKGKNAIGVMLGGGFYSMNPVDRTKRYIKLFCNYGAPKMKMMLHIEYEDGSVTNVVSDKTWKVTESPVTFSSVYGGEDYDATRYLDGWMQPGYKEKGWKNVFVSDYQPMMASQQYDPITVHQVLSPMNIFKNKKGWVYDLGQNASGTFRLTVKGKKGAKITIHPAEILDPDSTASQVSTGTFYGGLEYYTYTLGGKEEETWQPQFSYYGFRYLQVEGAVPFGKENADSLPQVESMVGLHTCNSAPEAGSFSCSKPMFNKIHNLIDWAMRSNMSSVFTDCPHREKLGWLEQDHLMQYSLQYRYNLSRFYKKVVRDMQLAQTAEGIIPDICPEFTHFKGGFFDSPEWGSTFVISPYYYYLWYGDKSLLEKNYPYMQKYVDYLGTRANNHIVAYGLGDWYDVGPKNPGGSQLTTSGVTATCSYYYEVKILQKTAELMGKTADAEKYATLAKDIRQSFNDKFFHKDSCYYDRNSQAANALPVFLGIVEPQYKQGVIDNLIKDIRSRGNGVSAGDIGYRYVVQVLEQNNRADIIYDMNSRYDVPGYGYQLAHGATALTEAWNALRSSSNNHFMMGHLMEWFYSGLGGIRLDEENVGFKKVWISPQMAGDVTYARTSYESPYGTIQSNWRLNGNEYTLQVNIPVNSTAVVTLPTNDVNAITEYGQPIARRDGILSVETSDGTVRLNVGSGEYLFKVLMDK
jgi:alpha-L-rhamnosidase